MTLAARIRDDRGVAAFSFALWATLIASAMLLAFYSYRVVGAHGEATDAAQAAARAATLAGSPDLAAGQAQAAIATALPTGRSTCETSSVSVDTSDWFGGGLVSATVTCSVRISDLSGLFPAVTRSATWVESVDPARRGARP